MRYNLKNQQKSEIYNQICIDFAHSPNSYTRMVFLRMMSEAASIYSSTYFKEYFVPPILSLLEDPVAIIRLKVVLFLPSIKSSLRLPADKKLATSLESIMNTAANEKDKDVSAALRAVALEMNNIVIRVDGQPVSFKISLGYVVLTFLRIYVYPLQTLPKTYKQDLDDLKKYEEEKKLEAMSAGRATNQASRGVQRGGKIRK